MMISDHAWRALKLMGVGGISFWLPDVLIHSVRGHKFGGADVLVVSVVLPSTFLAAYLWAAKRFRDEPRGRLVGRLILGVWLLGGFFTMLGASFAGEGFASPDGPQGAVVLTLASVVPLFTYMMSTYDGSLLALLVVSAAALVIFLAGRSKTRQSPDATG